MTNHTQKPRLQKFLAGIALAAVLTGGATAITSTPPAEANDSISFVEAYTDSKAKTTSAGTSSFGSSFQSWGVSWQ